MVNPLFRRLYRTLLVATALLIALGGATRAMDAGLACPDWPLCFGRIIPDFHPQVYFEFIHRALAGSVSVVVLGLHAWLFFNPRVSRSIKIVAASSLLLLLAQIVLGGLTVLKLLQSHIVTLHLAFGTAFFSSMLWVGLNVADPNERPAVPHAYRLWSMVLALAVYGQILLGGWVASNYAGLACVDFPRCNGQWLPSLVGSVGIQMIHRFGAYTLSLLILFNLAWVWQLRRQGLLSERLQQGAWYLAALILIQICLGVANVKFMIPPLITVLHLLTAVAMLALAVRAVFLTTTEPTEYPAGDRDGRGQRRLAADSAQQFA